MQTYVPDSFPIAWVHNVSSWYSLNNLVWDRPSVDVPCTEGLQAVWKTGAKLKRSLWSGRIA